MPVPLLILDALDHEPHPASLLDEEGRFRYVNGAWNHAAGAAGAPELAGPRLLGTRFLDHVHGPDREHLEGVLGRVASLPRSATGGVVQLGECNAGLSGRLVATRFLPVFAVDSDTHIATVVMHVTVAEFPVASRYSIGEPRRARYATSADLVRQCCCCRRVHAPTDDVWEYVPAYVEVPPAGTSHALCPTCFAAYYAEPDAPEESRAEPDSPDADGDDRAAA